MPSTRSPRNPSSPKKHSPIITRKIGGGILKRRKSMLSPKSSSVITPDRRPRLPRSKQHAALLRGLQGFVMQNMSGYCGRAELDQTEDVMMKDMSVFYDLTEPDTMDTREDYEWDFPGFDGISCKSNARPFSRDSSRFVTSRSSSLYLRFPITPSQLHPERVADWLANAPKITRDQAPVKNIQVMVIFGVLERQHSLWKLWVIL
ncbi:hypothetical protein DID88_005948 [Monilinia fructigena]|uniref:Uncharacterized protein n=1 Tax=Monilinia fructigena TaxID=38457 RepID=A0A395J197_9HELO|nr:hypothetical protein DID88_005948 [Monilinia fructigena]